MEASSCSVQASKQTSSRSQGLATVLSCGSSLHSISIHTPISVHHSISVHPHLWTHPISIHTPSLYTHHLYTHTISVHTPSLYTNPISAHAPPLYTGSVLLFVQFPLHMRTHNDGCPSLNISLYLHHVFRNQSPNTVTFSVTTSTSGPWIGVESGGVHFRQ